MFDIETPEGFEGLRGFASGAGGFILFRILGDSFVNFQNPGIVDYVTAFLFGVSAAIMICGPLWY